MLSEYSELGKIEKFKPQISDTHLYKYDWNYYLSALMYVPGLILFSYLTYVSVEKEKLSGMLWGVTLLLWNLLLFINVATSVLCTPEGIKVRYLFLFSRTMRWDDIKRMRLEVGNIPTCRIFSKRFSLPITFNLTPPGTLTDKMTLLATIKSRAKLFDKEIKNNTEIIFR